MKILVASIICLGFGFVIPTASASDDVTFEDAKSICKQIGFKPQTEKYQNCVLEIYSKNKREKTQPEPQFADVNVFGECLNLGLVQGSSEFSQCYVKLKEIKTQQIMQQQSLSATNDSNKRVNDLESARILLGIAAQGFGLAAGQSQQPTISIQQPILSPPIKFTTPKGNSYTCSTMGNSISCR